MSLAMRTLSMLTVAALLAVALPASAQEGLEPGIYNPYQSTPTTMWFHINGFQDFPVNTQPPDDRYADTPSFGAASHSGCFNVEGNSLAGQSRHTWYGYSSPSYVEYEFAGETGDGPRIHQERGISFDVELDTNVQPVLTWYFETAWINADEQTAPVNGVPTAIPQVIVRGTIREGDAVSVGHSAFNVGAIVAQAETPPMDLIGPTTTTTENVEYVQGPDGKHLYKITLPLDFGETNGRINKDESYNIRVDAFIDNPGCPGPGADGGDYLMLDFIRVHTSANFRPTLEWSVMNPLRIEYLHPMFIGDDMVIHTSTNSPWGNYDVRGDRPDVEGEALQIDIEGPSQAITIERASLTARFHEHNFHTEAVDATWIWSYKKDNAKEGQYKVTFTAINDQERPESQATAVALFEIGSGRVLGCGGQEQGGGNDDCVDEIAEDGRTRVEESPGVGTLAVLGLLAAAGLAMRRRS